MGFFLKKLTDEQQEEVKKFTDRLHSICIPCVRDWGRFMQDMYELMLVCQPARRNESDSLRINGLRKPALKRVTEYRNFLADAQLRFTSLEIGDWFPKQLKTEIDTWDLFFKGQVSPLFIVIESLNPLDPSSMLTREGGVKLNMFVSGMNMIAAVHRLSVVTENSILLHKTDSSSVISFISSGLGTKITKSIKEIPIAIIKTRIQILYSALKPYILAIDLWLNLYKLKLRNKTIADTKPI
jgi:hypothetical protein